MLCKVFNVFRWIFSVCFFRVLFLLNQIKFSTRRIHVFTRVKWRAIERTSLLSIDLITQMLLIKFTNDFDILKVINKSTKHCVQVERRNNLSKNSFCSFSRIFRIEIFSNYARTLVLISFTISWYSEDSNSSLTRRSVDARSMFSQSWLKYEKLWW